VLARSADPLERIVGHIARTLAILVALAIPLGYGLTLLEDTSLSLDFKAKVKASAMSSLIADMPHTWSFAENRIQGLISREPVPLENELVEVFDEDNSIISRAGVSPSGLTLSRDHRLFDGDTSVGRIVVTGSLASVIRNTLICAVLSILLAIVVYITFKTLPFRALKAVSNDLEAEKERAETTLHSIGEAVVTTDANGRINYLNPVAEQLLGRSLSEVRGNQVRNVIQLRDTSTGEVAEDPLYTALSKNVIVTGAENSELLRPDGTIVAIEGKAAPINDRSGTVSGGVIVLRDVSIAREFVRQRSWEATHDPLTGLCNRREFERRVRLALEAAQKTGHSHVVCYLDLDHFKVVNDSCGHAAGDELLVRVTNLILERIRNTDTVARLGGDEFGLLLDDCDGKRGVLIASEIVSAIHEFKFHWESTVCNVGVSIGLTVISPFHLNVAEILSEADSACYWAKEQGKNRVLQFCANNMNLSSRRKEIGWVARINSAIADNRFVLFHQTYKAMGPSPEPCEHLEVLLRMIGDDNEIIAPGRFLPAAERYGLMPEIDRWVIHEVFSRYHSLLADRGGKPLTCAINLSGASINAEGFIDYIRDLAAEYRIGPDAICFELTETVAVNNLQAAVDFIQACKSIGFQFALDDFGTGTSSFGYLKSLPVDYLKIDGSFVVNMEHNTVDRVMVETINKVGHLLGKRTIAEFAKNEAIVAQLDSIGVDFAQGYGVCVPTPLFT
jgi:diguanylate cyclase (GGDEF)-like protein/PAS domain S-box-containing protein